MRQPRYEVDTGSGFVDEWRIVAALEAALASQPRLQALLEHALPTAELAANANAIGLELSSDDIEGIRRRVQRLLGASTVGDDAASLLRLARQHARQTAAVELGRLAATGGPERAQALSPTYRPSRNERPALARPDLWEELVAAHWTTLPIFDADHFQGFFLRSLPRRMGRLARTADALVTRGPTVGRVGGDEAAAVLATTTAATAD